MEKKKIKGPTLQVFHSSFLFILFQFLCISTYMSLCGYTNEGCRTSWLWSRLDVRSVQSSHWLDV